MKLRLWVEILLLLISAIAFVIFASDSEDLMLFIGSKLIAIVVLWFNLSIIEKYGKVFNK